MRLQPKPMAPGTGIELDDLTLAYDRRPAVHHLTGRFDSGSLTAITGPNGAGKSTLLKSLVGLLEPNEGRISIDCLSRHELAYLPQQSDIDRSFPISVADTVALGLWRQIGVFGAATASMRSCLAEALRTVGLDGFGGRPIGMLSVGQLQRVLFARLLLQDASVVLLDEPFAALDARTTADLLALVHRWHAEGRTVIAILHDVELIRGHFPECLLLAREPVAWGATPSVLTPANLFEARKLSDGWAAADEGRTGRFRAVPPRRR